MATTGVLGNGPISFFDKSTHGQVSIPLSALIFNGSVLTISPDAKRTDLSDLLTKGLSQWLAYQASQGFVVPAPTAPAAPAMVFKAQDPGVTGNDVTVQIVYPTVTTYKATVTKTDTYTGLKKDTIEGVLGLVGPPVVPGSQPGLLRVKDASAFTGPAVPITTVVVPAVATTDLAVIKLDFGGGNKLDLGASRAGPDGNNISVELTVTDAPSGTFSLTATWTTVININTTKLPATAAWSTAGYVLNVSAPSGGTLGAPQAGLYVLRGGADAAPAATATATALAAS